MEAKRENTSTTATSVQRPATQPCQTETFERPLPRLDFAALDLTVERVEERISPSETNVFDR